MTILIKSSAKGRTCSYARNDPVDILSALKGLTLKLEIKITEVVISDQKPVIDETKLEPMKDLEKTTVKLDHACGFISPPRRETIQLERKPTKPELKVEHESEAFARKISHDTVNKDEDHHLAKEETPQVAKSVIYDQPILSKWLSGREAFLPGSVHHRYCLSVDETVNPPIAFIPYNPEDLIQVNDFLTTKKDDLEKLPHLDSVEVGDIVIGKSNDDGNFYRCRVISVADKTIKVDYFDWGLKEDLTIESLRKYSIDNKTVLETWPPCAVAIKFMNPPGKLLDSALKCESTVALKIQAFNEKDDYYLVTILETD